MEAELFQLLAQQFKFRLHLLFAKQFKCRLVLRLTILNKHWNPYTFASLRCFHAGIARTPPWLPLCVPFGCATRTDDFGAEARVTSGSTIRHADKHSVRRWSARQTAHARGAFPDPLQRVLQFLGASVVNFLVAEVITYRKAESAG